MYFEGRPSLLNRLYRKQVEQYRKCFDWSYIVVCDRQIWRLYLIGVAIKAPPFFRLAPHYRNRPFTRTAIQNTISAVISTPKILISLPLVTWLMQDNLICV